MLRSRAAVAIRADALKMAIRKATTGCYACAHSYFALARKHGATEEEVYRAIDAAVESDEKGISRRVLLKIAAGVLVGGTLSAGELLPQRAEAASHLRLQQQPICVLDAALTADGVHQRGGPRPWLWDSR